MLTTRRRLEEYGQQLDAWSRAFAAGQTADVPLCGAWSGLQREMFAQNLFGKRVLKLERQLEFLEPAFPDLNRRIGMYVEEHSASAHDHGLEDARSCLEWLSRERLTDEQQDCVVCLKSRHTVQQIASRRRADHLAFVRLAGPTRDRLRTLTPGSPLKVVPNPLTAWETFRTTALIGDDEALPADALFFAAGRDIRTAVFDAVGRALIESLVSLNDVTVRDWCGASNGVANEERFHFVLDLAELRIVGLADQ